jgi:hypothetical protein
LGVAATDALKVGKAAERTGVDLALTCKPGWTAAQRAEADLKVKILTAGDMVVSQSTRSLAIDHITLDRAAIIPRLKPSQLRRRLEQPLNP